jgi:cell envelope opacity-associated protein A
MKKTDLIPKDLQTELTSEEKDLGEALALVQAFVIPPVGAPDHPEALAFAEESRALTKEQWAAYEAKRTEVTKPLNAALKSVNSWFRPVQSALKDMEALWSRKIVDVAMAARAEQARLIEEARATEAPAVMRESLVAASESVIAPTTLTLRERWVFEVTDPAALPREYLCPDLAKIGAVVAALKDQHGIPGVAAKNDPVPYSRPK